MACSVAFIFSLTLFCVIRRRRMAQLQAQAAYADAMAAQQNAGAQGWSQGGAPPPGYPTDLPYGTQGPYVTQNGQAPYAYSGYPTYTADGAACGANGQPVYGYPAYPAPGQPGVQPGSAAGFQNIDLTQAGAAANAQHASGGKV